MRQCYLRRGAPAARVAMRCCATASAPQTLAPDAPLPPAGYVAVSATTGKPFPASSTFPAMATAAATTKGYFSSLWGPMSAYYAVGVSIKSSELKNYLPFTPPTQSVTDDDGATVETAPHTRGRAIKLYNADQTTKPWLVDHMHELIAVGDERGYAFTGQWLSERDLKTHSLSLKEGDHPPPVELRDSRGCKVRFYHTDQLAQPRFRLRAASVEFPQISIRTGVAYPSAMAALLHNYATQKGYTSAFWGSLKTLSATGNYPLPGETPITLPGMDGGGMFNADQTKYPFLAEFTPELMAGHTPSDNDMPVWVWSEHVPLIRATVKEGTVPTCVTGGDTGAKAEFYKLSELNLPPQFPRLMHGTYMMSLDLASQLMLRSKMHGYRSPYWGTKHQISLSGNVLSYDQDPFRCEAFRHPLYNAEQTQHPWLAPYTPALVQRYRYEEDGDNTFVAARLLPHFGLRVQEGAEPELIPSDDGGEPANFYRRAQCQSIDGPYIPCDMATNTTLQEPAVVNDLANAARLRRYSSPLWGSLDAVALTGNRALVHPNESDVRTFHGLLNADQTEHPWLARFVQPLMAHAAAVGTGAAPWVAASLMEDRGLSRNAGAQTVRLTAAPLPLDGMADDPHAPVEEEFCLRQDCTAAVVCMALGPIEGADAVAVLLAFKAHRGFTSPYFGSALIMGLTGNRIKPDEVLNGVLTPYSRFRLYNAEQTEFPELAEYTQQLYEHIRSSGGSLTDRWVPDGERYAALREEGGALDGPSETITVDAPSGASQQMFHRRGGAQWGTRSGDGLEDAAEHALA